MEVITPVATPLFCDCCGKQKLAEIRGTKLVIYDTRHGQRHFISIEVKELLAIIERHDIM